MHTYRPHTQGLLTCIREFHARKTKNSTNKTLPTFLYAFIMQAEAGGLARRIGISRWKPNCSYTGNFRSKTKLQRMRDGVGGGIVYEKEGKKKNEKKRGKRYMYIYKKMGCTSAINGPKWKGIRSQAGNVSVGGWPAFLSPM